MFHAPMGRFQLELIYYFTYFPPSSHPTVVFFCRPFVVNTFSTGLVENVVLTTKGLQESNTQLLDGTTVRNRQDNKLILIEIFPSVHETSYLELLVRGKSEKFSA